MIFRAPKASWELRFVSKRLLATDFEALEGSGAPRGDQESLRKLPKKPQEAPQAASKRLPRRPEKLLGPELPYELRMLIFLLEFKKNVSIFEILPIMLLMMINDYFMNIWDISDLRSVFYLILHVLLGFIIPNTIIC